MINRFRTEALNLLQIFRKVFTKWWIWSILSIVSFVVGFLFGKRMNCLLFNNTDGKFDYEIMWTAIGAIVTAIISFVSVWQTKRATSISELSLKNEFIRNSCVIDFDDANEPCVSIKDYIDNQGKGLYVRFKNFGNIDIENYSATVSFLDTSSKTLKLLPEYTSFNEGAFLRRGGTNSLTIKIPPLYNNLLQMRIDFRFITASGVTKNQSLTSQFILCEGNSLDMREKYINFYKEDK